MNSDNKTLVILIPGFPESEADTTCLPSQQNFIRKIKELYPQLPITILSFQYPYHTNPYRWNNIDIIPFAGKNKGGIPRLLLRRKIIRTLRQLHRNRKIIGLLSFWYGECAWVGKYFGDKHDIPHYCWIRGQDARKENKYPKRKPHLPNELIALSDFLQREFEKNHGIRPAHVIPPGIDSNTFSVDIPGKDIDILAAGSLIQLKRYDRFLQIVAAIQQKKPAISAMLIGKGPEEEALKRMVVEMKLEKNVVLTGELPYPEVLQYMQRSKIFLHSSSYEGFSGVCLEALAAGCKVISFCRAMERDIENWHIVRDEEAMKEVLIKLLQDDNGNYKLVMPYGVEDSVKKVMMLFGGNY